MLKSWNELINTEKVKEKSIFQFENDFFGYCAKSNCLIIHVLCVGDYNNSHNNLTVN
jgi:hypothetical protein